MTWKSKTDSFPEVRETGLQQRARDSSSLIGNIGNTPLLRIRNISNPNSDVQIYAKAEWFNPGGSIKDRPALSMLLDAERSGALTKDKIIIDATSGNTGIAYAMIGSALRYKVMLAFLQMQTGSGNKHFVRTARKSWKQIRLPEQMERSKGQRNCCRVS